MQISMSLDKTLDFVNLLNNVDFPRICITNK